MAKMRCKAKVSKVTKAQTGSTIEITCQIAGVMENSRLPGALPATGPQPAPPLQPKRAACGRSKFVWHCRSILACVPHAGVLLKQPDGRYYTPHASCGNQEPVTTTAGTQLHAGRHVTSCL